MKHMIGAMLAVIFAQLYLDGYHLVAAAIAFITGMWCAWPATRTATCHMKESER